LSLHLNVLVDLNLKTQFIFASEAKNDNQRSFVIHFDLNAFKDHSVDGTKLFGGWNSKLERLLNESPTFGSFEISFFFLLSGAYKMFFTWGHSQEGNEYIHGANALAYYSFTLI
jgi:hypothetical protein